MKKFRIKDTTNEMSTTGTGASFTSGQGEQYASPKSFKIKKDKKEGIDSPFDHSAPSIPNRPSKAIDYKQLFQEIEVGDVQAKDGVKTTVRDIDPETGSVSWKVEYVPAFDTTFKEFQELNKFIKTLAQKTEDTTIDSIADQVTKLFNQYRTHIRKNYPDSYKRYASNPTLEHESLNEARYSQFKKTTEVRTPTEQIHRAVREIRRKIDEITKVVGHTERMKNELKSSNEGMSYLKRTKNAINKISEKIQELNNRIKGLTE
jgi:predicted transcriptional regulator